MKFKGLKRYHSNGNQYIYHRATGRRLGVNLQEDDPKFVAAYLDAISEAKSEPKLELVKPNSVADICRRFIDSKKFGELSKGYQDNLRRDTVRLCAEANGTMGAVRFASIRRVHIEAQKEKLERNPGNQRLKLWRYLFEYAVAKEVVSIDATSNVKANPEVKTGGHKPWTFKDIETFRRFWPLGTRQRLAFELQYWAGARISDTRELGPSNIDQDGWLNFTQTKTKSDVSVPMYRDLPYFAEASDLQHLLAAIASLPVDQDTWFETEGGQVRSAKGSSQWFARAARSAKLEGKTSHGLRKSRMVLHAENGATTKEIAAWSGHETLNEIERYIRSADRRKLLTPSALKTGKFL